MKTIDEVVEILKTQVTEKKFLDVGAGAEKMLDISQVRLSVAVNRLREQGYARMYLKVSRPGTDDKITLKVLALPGTTFKEVFENRGGISPLSRVQMTKSELETRVRDILPEASFGHDNDGQIIIYTNLAETDRGIFPIADDEDVQQYLRDRKAAESNPA